MGKVVKVVLIAFAIIIGVCLIAFCAYLIYLQRNFYRNVDGSPVEVHDDHGDIPDVSGTYTVLTYNIGFGAYDPTYTFFMDTGEMTDGTPTRGVHARPSSEEQMYADLDGVIRVIGSYDPDFCLVQEIDQGADRTFGSDQVGYLTSAFPDRGYTYGSNFHTAYLAYPFREPLGHVRGGLLTLSRYGIGEATWRSYPIDMGFIVKFTDLDRGFTVHRIPTSDGRQLVLVNSHMSAYDSGGTVRARQMEALDSFLVGEREAGSYVIVGGDFNQAIGGTEATFPSAQNMPSWIATFDEGGLSDGYHMVHADNLYEVPTCRGADIPWEEGVDYTCVIDGFIVSDNITARAENLDTSFTNSDHNPVLLTFELGQGVLRR